MIITPIPPDGMKYGLHPRGGFDVMLQPALADKLHAPDSEEFLKFLNDRLLKDELATGHRYCEFGYKLNSMYWYKGEFANFNATCLPDPSEKQNTK